MATNQEEYREINLVDVFAYCIKKFVLIFIIACVGAVLGNIYNYYRVNKPENIEKYERNIAAYNDTLKNMEESVAHLKVLRDAQIAKNAENPIMGLEGKDIYTTTVTFRVSSSDGTMFFNNNGAVLYPYTDKVIAYWTSLDLALAINSNYKNDYLKQLIVLENVKAPSEFLTLTVWGSSSDRTKQIAETITDLLSSYCSSIGDVSFDTMSMQSEISNSTKVQEIIKQNLDAVFDFENQINELIDGKDGIEEFKKKEPKQSGYGKATVIGFFAGAILSAVALFCSLVFQDKVTNSTDASKRLDVPLLGAIYSDNGPFDRFARKVIGERIWKDKESALHWLDENIDNYSLKSGSKIALMSSRNDKKTAAILECVKSVLQKKNHHVTILTDTYQNPQVNSVIQSSDEVILVEKQFSSTWKRIMFSCEVTKRYDKRIAGLIIC